jgi:hypothetical protein
MILRRVIQHIKKQEWTAIWIDLLIVIVGVFIGIQVQQWSNERSERRQERVYLERILSDIKLSIETNELNIQRLTTYSDEQYFVVNSLRQCSLSDDMKDTFADGMSDIGKVGPSVFVQSTVDEMLSAGNFSIIRNAKIRDTLNGLSRDAKYQDNIFTAIYAQLASAASATNNRVIWIYPDHKTPFDPVAWDDMDIDFNALCQDKEFQAAVSTIRYLTNAGISLNTRALVSLRSAKAELEAELGIATTAMEAMP